MKLSNSSNIPGTIVGGRVKYIILQWLKRLAKMKANPGSQISEDDFYKSPDEGIDGKA